MAAALGAQLDSSCQSCVRNRYAAGGLHCHKAGLDQGVEGWALTFVGAIASACQSHALQ